MPCWSFGSNSTTQRKLRVQKDFKQSWKKSSTWVPVVAGLSTGTEGLSHFDQSVVQGIKMPAQDRSFLPGQRVDCLLATTCERPLNADVFRRYRFPVLPRQAAVCRFQWFCSGEEVARPVELECCHQPHPQRELNQGVEAFKSIGSLARHSIPQLSPLDGNARQVAHGHQAVCHRIAVIGIDDGE